MELPEFSIGDSLSYGWAAFKKHYGILLAVSAIVVVASIAMSLIDQGIQSVAAQVGGTQGALLVISAMFTSYLLDILVMYPLSSAAAFMGVRAARGETPKIEYLNDAVRCWGKIVLVYLLFVVIGLVMAIPMAAVVGATLLVVGRPSGDVFTTILVLSMLITFGLYLYVFIRLYPATYAAIDPLEPNRSATDCLRYSWKLTEGRALPLFGLAFIVWFMVIGSILLVCVGYVLLGVPLAIAIGGAAYAMLSNVPTDRCAQCGYSLRGISVAYCPECGTPVPTNTGAFGSAF